MKVKSMLATIVSISLLLSVNTFAKDNGNKKNKKVKQQKAKQLPKGLQKKLNRGGTLPSGWRDKLIVGSKVDNRVLDNGRVLYTSDYSKPEYKTPGTEVYKINDKIIKVLSATNVILDVLDLNK